MFSGAGLILGITFIPTPPAHLILVYGLAVGLGGGAVVMAILTLIIVYVVRNPILPKRKDQSLPEGVN